MSSIVILTPAEHEQLTGLARRATRPASPYQNGPPDPERATAVMLASLRVVLGAPVVAALADAPWHILTVADEPIADENRVIRGAVLLFHHTAAGWMVLGDELGELHVLDSPDAPTGIADPLLVDGAAAPADAGAGAQPLLRPYRVRGIAMALAFDAVANTWYRSRQVVVTPDPAPTTS